MINLKIREIFYISWESARTDITLALMSNVVVGIWWEISIFCKLPDGIENFFENREE
ncbi:hypothetical protein M3189_04880 [Neobacillus niacini]|nr:hypothetical protein [Neobacillus niacini]